MNIDQIITMLNDGEKICFDRIYWNDLATYLRFHNIECNFLMWISGDQVCLEQPERGSRPSCIKVDRDFYRS